MLPTCHQFIGAGNESTKSHDQEKQLKKLEVEQVFVSHFCPHSPGQVEPARSRTRRAAISAEADEADDDYVKLEVPKDEVALVQNHNLSRLLTDLCVFVATHSSRPCALLLVLKSGAKRAGRSYSQVSSASATVLIRSIWRQHAGQARRVW